MTDYNDGKWHGWNGGDCPVHPKSVVEYLGVCADTALLNKGEEAGMLYWTEGTDIKAFRVIKAYVEPREFWISKHNICYVLPHKPESNDPAEFIHVREVLDND